MKVLKLLKRYPAHTTDEIVVAGEPSVKLTTRLNSHASRHGYGGEDAIPEDALRFSQIAKSFGSESSVSVDAGATYTVPKGVYLVSLAANTSVEYTPDGGTTWRTLIPAGQGGLVVSDGSSVRLTIKR